MTPTIIMTDALRVLIADDHPLMLTGVEARLEAEPGLEVVGRASSAQQLLAESTRLEPDVIVADLALADRSLLDVLSEIVAALPAVRVLVLTASGDAASVINALEAGAAGYVSKDTDSSRLVEHIRAVAAGQTVLDQHASSALAARLRARAAGTTLSPREVEVLRLVGRGYSNRKIADELFLSPSTVKTHFDRIFEKLGVNGRADALAAAKKLGLL